MKLTRRQEDFIHKMLDLYRELQGPIHYTVMAERLGVSRFTAYDMLRLLEEKGLVISEYQLAESKSGPGRSEVVFIPSPEAHRLFASLAGETAGEGWEAIKTRALEKVRAGELYDQELIKEVLARTPPEGPGPLRYCVEVMTIAALRLRSSAGRRLLLEYLPGILPGVESATRPISACWAALPWACWPTKAPTPPNGGASYWSTSGVTRYWSLTWIPRCAVSWRRPCPRFSVC